MILSLTICNAARQKRAKTARGQQLAWWPRCMPTSALKTAIFTADLAVPVLPARGMQFVTIPAKPNISAEAQELDYVFNIPEDHLPGLHWVRDRKKDCALGVG